MYYIYLFRNFRPRRSPHPHVYSSLQSTLYMFPLGRGDEGSADQLMACYRHTCFAPIMCFTLLLGSRLGLLLLLLLFVLLDFPNVRNKPPPPSKEQQLFGVASGVSESIYSFIRGGWFPMIYQQSHFLPTPLFSSVGTTLPLRVRELESGRAVTTVVDPFRNLNSNKVKTPHEPHVFVHALCMSLCMSGRTER